MKIYRLNCSRCNGTLDYDKDNPILFCPYCGEKIIFVESDAVKIQKIKSDTKKAMQDSRQNHQIDMEVLKYGIEKEKNRDQSKDTILALLAGIGLCAGIVLFCYFMAKIFA